MEARRFRSRIKSCAVLLSLAIGASAAWAQSAGGVLQGSVVDEQSAAVAGATVTATNTATGGARVVTSDSDGSFRFGALPAGTYDLKVEQAGFAPYTEKGVVVNVAATRELAIGLKVTSVEEMITVTSDAPLIATTPAIGAVISQNELQNLPLNGRQFANVAVLAPGTALSYNSDPTKPGQLTVLLNGGNGRNINFLIDGGDNTDDTIGGALQNFNLEAVQEFNILTTQYKAEFGRSSGGVLSVVTKTGTNDFAASVYEYYRDDSLNAKTETEKRSGADKQEYSRDMYGVTLGGPIVRDKAHFFATYEKLDQETSYTINTKGVFPSVDGSSQPTPFEDELITVKATWNLNPSQYLQVRYGYQKNSQTYGASPLTLPSALGTLTNEYDSILVGHTAQIGSSLTNEVLYQYSSFDNLIAANSDDPTVIFPDGVKQGQNVNTPQDTRQRKRQLKDDLSWSTQIRDQRHDFRFGVEYMDEPTLGGSFETGTTGQFTLLTNDPNGPVTLITQNGGSADFSTPIEQTSLYVQDDWYFNDRLTFNVGLRYDYWDGFDLDQSSNVIFQTLRSQRTYDESYLRDFWGASDKLSNDDDNFAPRLGFTWDVKGDARHILRGGYGTFYNFPYTNATILFPAVSAFTSFGQIYFKQDNNGIKNPDGSFYRVGQPLPPGDLPEGPAPPSDVASPTLATPYSDQISLGYSWQAFPWLGINVEAISIDYHDLPFRFRANGSLDSDGNQLAGPRFPLGNFRIWYGGGRGKYDGINIGARVRKPNFELQGFYTYSETDGNTLAGADEFRITDRITQPDYHALRSDGSQNFRDPLCGACFGPFYTDSKHRLNLGGTWDGIWGIKFSGFLRYKSALPYTKANSAGVDLNGDGFRNDLEPGVKHVNSERGDSFTQVDIGLSREFRFDSFGVEVIAQMFNVFNEKNPAAFDRFGVPGSFAGDGLQGEQQMIQLGLRLRYQ